MIDYNNNWMKLKGYNMNSRGEYEYILWRNQEADGRYLYQITKGEKPVIISGYYDKTALLKLKGLKDD